MYDHILVCEEEWERTVLKGEIAAGSALVVSTVMRPNVFSWLGNFSPVFFRISPIDGDVQRHRHSMTEGQADTCTEVSANTALNPDKLNEFVPDHLGGMHESKENYSGL